MNLDEFKNALKEGGCEDVGECSDEKLILIQIAMSLMTQDEFHRFIDLTKMEKS